MDAVSDPAPAFRLTMLGGLALRRTDGSAETSLAGRRLGLLAYLALAERPLTRDHLADVFWGDRDESRARHSLREALSSIRQVLGPHAIGRRTESIALADGAVDVDARRFDAAFRAGAWREVIALYGGPLLDGVHLDAAERFEEWSSAERARCERRVLHACAEACRELDAASDAEGCRAVAERWIAIDPSSDAAAAALARTDAHRATPSTSVVPLSSAVERAAPSVAPPRRRRSGARAAAAVVAALGIAGAWLVARHVATASAGAPSVRPTLVVAAFDVSAADSADSWLRDGAPQLVGAALAREHVADVVEPERLRDVIQRGRHPGPPSGLTVDDALEAARRLGATWLVSGAITRGGRQYLIDATLRDVASGAVRHRTSVADTGLFSAVARITAGLVPTMDAPEHGPRLEDIETTSTVAYRAYVRGRALLTEGRYDDAGAAFDAAIRADSGFASALIARRRLLASAFAPAAIDSARRLMMAYARVRDRAGDFDRQDFEAFIAFREGDHLRAEALARALVDRYPRDPRAYERLVDILTHHGRFAEAVEALTRSLALDSLGRGAGDGPCASCAGFVSLALLRLVAGDLPHAEIDARRAVALQPQAPAAWAALGEVLSARGQFAEAIDAAQHAARLAPRAVVYSEGMVRRLIEARRLDDADAAVSAWLVAADPPLTLVAIDLRATLLRERGRYQEAARLLESTERADASGLLLLALASTRAQLGDATGAARALGATGEGHPAVAGVSSMPAAAYPTEDVRFFAWSHALLADALYLAGSSDTFRLRLLADSIQVVGARSYYARDWRLHHHVRGLIAMRAGRWSDAEAEFERARFGRAGWTRTLVELARARLALGRPCDAVAALRDAHATAIDGMARYAPRSEIDLWMARALAAAGETDSARIYASSVRRAWISAEPSVQARLASLVP